MKLVFTWYVPDTLTITDPALQGPTVAPSRDGLTNVITGTNWALKTEAQNDDGTPMATTNTNPAVHNYDTHVVDVISHYTPFGQPNPETFTDVTKMSREELQGWLETCLFQKLSKADQEQQATDRIMKKISPTTTFKMPTAATAPAPISPSTNGKE